MQHADYRRWQLDVDTLLNEFRIKCGDSGRGACPVALDRRADFLSCGPCELSDEAVFHLIEQLVIWGVCTISRFPDHVFPSEEYVVYSGIAGLLHRHHRQGVPVPFYAECSVVTILYDLGKRVHGCDNDQYAQYHCDLDATMKARRTLERRVLYNGGNMASGEYPGTMKLIHAQNALIADHKANLPGVASFYAVEEKHGLKKCDWSSGRWQDTFVRDYDLDSDEENTTLQEYTVPLPQDPPVFPYQYPMRVDPGYEQGSRVGQMQKDNSQVVSNLNPSPPPQTVTFQFSEYGDNVSRCEGVSAPTLEFEHEGHWFGDLHVSSKQPEKKGIAVFILGALQWTEGFTGNYGRNRGHPNDILQYNGEMFHGEPHGFGDLLHEGKTLYSGMWKHGLCDTDGKTLPGCKRMSPREVYRLYLMRKDWFCRFEPDSVLPGQKLCLEVKGWSLEEGRYVLYQVSVKESIHAVTKRFGISAHVMRYLRRPDVKRRGVWADFTVGCATQEYVKCVQCRNTDSPQLYVTTAIGPRESYANDDDYEYAPYASAANGFSMFQNFLNPLNVVGLEAVGAFKGGKHEDMPQFVGLFRSIDNRYVNMEENKWSITADFVTAYFGRFIELLYMNVNKMINLRALGELDRAFDKNNTLSDGWLLYPRAGGLTFPKFRFWTDRPKNLATIVQGCVYNLFEVQYAPGGRWRFFGRFNHELHSVTQTWFQLDESWMAKYLVPKCVQDLYEQAPPFTKIDVHKTGNDGESPTLQCVKQCVLPIVPPDDAEVLKIVKEWANEVVFHLTVGRMCDLSKQSLGYVYNAKKMSTGAMAEFLNADSMRQRDADVVIRPIDPKGTLL